VTRNGQKCQDGCWIKKIIIGKCGKLVIIVEYVRKTSDFVPENGRKQRIKMSLSLI
jgi:hypothetical protein